MQDISGDSPNEMNEHAPGLFYLLEQRGFEQLATERGTELFFLSLLRLVGDQTNLWWCKGHADRLQANILVRQR